jgi:hypothetical protein
LILERQQNRESKALAEIPRDAEGKAEEEQKQRDDYSQNCSLSGLMNSRNRADKGGCRADKGSQMTRLQKIING